MEDSQIVLLIQKESPEGMKQIIQKYRGYAGTIVARVLSGFEQDVEECIADTFVSLWKYINAGNDVNHLKGCVACTAKNTALNRLKQLNKENITDINETDLTSDFDVADWVENAENLKQVQELIMQMDEPDREIFVRKYFLMESLKEIAQKTLLDEIQIRNRLYRSRKKLRRQLEERGVAI